MKYNSKKEKAISYITEEIRSLELAPELNGCPMKPEWAEQLDIMRTCLEAVQDHFRDSAKMMPLTLEQLRGMVHQPAYLYIYDTALDSGWHIIKAVTEDKIIFRGWNTVYVPVSSLGKCFDLYAYPPPCIDREAFGCPYCKPDADGCVRKFGAYSIHGNTLETGHCKPQEIKYCPHCSRPLTMEAWA